MSGLKQVCVAVKKNLKTINNCNATVGKCLQNVIGIVFCPQPYHYIKWLQSDIQYIQNMKNTWLTTVVQWTLKRSTS